MLCLNSAGATLLVLGLLLLFPLAPLWTLHSTSTLLFSCANSSRSCRLGFPDFSLFQSFVSCQGKWCLVGSGWWVCNHILLIYLTVPISGVPRWKCYDGKTEKKTLRAKLVSWVKIFQFLKLREALSIFFFTKHKPKHYVKTEQSDVKNTKLLTWIWTAGLWLACLQPTVPPYPCFVTLSSKRICNSMLCLIFPSLVPHSSRGHLLQYVSDISEFGKFLPGRRTRFTSHM